MVWMRGRTKFAGVMRMWTGCGCATRRSSLGGRFRPGCEHGTGCAVAGAAAAAREGKSEPGHGLFLGP